MELSALNVSPSGVNSRVLLPRASQQGVGRQTDSRDERAHRECALRSSGTRMESVVQICIRI